MAISNLFPALMLRAVYLLHAGDLALSGRLYKPELRPENIWPGDALRGKQVFSGRFELAGGDVTFPGKIGWQSDKAGREWHEALHSFFWIRDVVAFSNTKLAARHVRDCIHHWVDNAHEVPPMARQAEVTGERVAQWLAHARFILAGADLSFRRRWLRSIAVQAIFLHRQAARHSPHAGLATIKALIYVGLCMPYTRYMLKGALRRLNRLLVEEIGEDGMHISRSPSVHLNALRNLIEIRAALQRRRGVQLSGLEERIHLMSAALRALMHGDGKLALFHDSIEEEPDLLRQTFAHAGGYMPASSRTQASGFCRLARGNLLVLVDAGLPSPDARRRHFSDLSLEVSAGNERIFTNCGGYRGAGEAWRRACRSTAAHSALCIDDLNAWEESAGVHPAPEAKREEQDGTLHLSTLSYGFVEKTGLVHRRRITADASGMLLSGIDSLTSATGTHDDATRQIAVRFHLHPGITPLRTESNDITLICPSGAMWKFTSSLQFACTVEESIYLGLSGHPRKASQIVISAPLRATDFTLEWSLTRVVKD